MSFNSLIQRYANPSKKFLGKLETGIVILIIIYHANVWWHPQTTDIGTITSAGSASIINLGIYLFTLICILLNWKRFCYVLTRDKLLLLLVGIALFSIFWSSYPDRAMNTAKGMMRVTFFGVYLSTRYSLKEQLYLLAWVSGIVAILSLAVCLGIPSQGIQASNLGDSVGWRGLLPHKNHFGRLMVFSSGSFLLLSLSSSKGKKFLWVGFGLCLSLLFLSNSKTALLAFILTLILLPFWIMLRQKSFNVRMFLIHIATLLIGFIFVGTAYYAEPILNSMGKDLTWNGRVPLWTILLRKIFDKPWIGYGYEGFWSRDQYTDIGREMAYGWGGGHAHNGFLEIILDLGLIGLIILLLGLLRSYWRAVNYARLTKSIEGLWSLQVLTIIMFVNIAISSTFLVPTFIWMLYVSITCTLALQYDRQKRSQSRHLRKYAT
ncbi:MAG: O-antigen ligase family protein [Cyanobacteria bacterium J06621_8]